ncbi:MAG TPA: flagellar basal body P-ring formation chaperone FlgA [Lacipirellulaceae bacterium]|jgi:flagella basal body P-ring formation protein FlgA|nr:flagellar basal body P-ring formation chaperone FlgA [Lacipirellulaceae bacterium]
MDYRQMNLNKSNLCVVIAFVVEVAVAMNSAVAVEVRLREKVVPKACVVRLGDIAEVAGKDREVTKKLAVIPLMPAPAPETQRFLRKREIADMLAANGVDIGDIHFTGAEQVAVSPMSKVQAAAFQESAKAGSGSQASRHGVVLASGQADAASVKLDDAQAADYKNELCRVISDYLKSKSGKSEIGTIDCSVPDRHLVQFAQSSVAPVCSGGSDPWLGKQKFTLAIVTPAGPAQITVNADVAEAATPMVVAKRPVVRGSVITAADVEVRTLEPSAKNAARRGGYDSIDKLIGMEAKQPLQQDEIVYTDEVQSPVLIKRGELITVSSRSGSICVRTSAKATQDGSKGDLIQVESIDSKQRYDARVVGLREASVFAPARIAAAQPERAKAGPPQSAAWNNR